MLDRLKKAMAEPGAIVVPRDPKIEARRANEEAAKRLIANPPEWAYPRAWKCAVLSAHETQAIVDYDFAKAIVPALRASIVDGDNSAGDDLSGCHRMIWRDSLDAYARGMEKPSGLMQRPRANDGRRHAGSVRCEKW